MKILIVVASLLNLHLLVSLLKQWIYTAKDFLFVDFHKTANGHVNI